MDDEFAKFYEECSEIEKAVKDNKGEIDADSVTSEKSVEIAADSTKTSDTPEDCSNTALTSSSTVNNDKEDKTVDPDISEKVQEKNEEPVPDEKSTSDACYVNPDTKEEFTWSKEMNQWVPKGFKPEFDGTTYKYTDQKGQLFKWDLEKSSWEKVDENKSEEPEKKYGFDGENYTYVDPKDNTVYFWDREKNAWFPKVDEDFMARYQMSYGFVDNTTKEEPEDNASKNKELKRKAPSEPTWFDLDDAHNTKVYVSNLPEDITEKEFVDFMQKCGLILKDIKTNQFKIKLYKEPDGTLKGDALCDYIKVESVDLALSVLDGADLKGKKVRVQRAKFQMKGNYNPSLKPKKKRKADKEKEKKMKEKLLDWRPDKLRGEREKHERTVVLKNLFSPSVFDENVALILEYTEDIRSEAVKCGVVRKVTLYDKHPEGVATITFSDAEEADICVKFFNNRWFSKRRLIAETWDGKTKYKVNESAEETKDRLEKWNKFLEDEDRVKK